MHPLRLPSAALCLLAAAACGEAPPPADDGPAADAAFTLLASLDAGAVAEAFRRLDGYAYTAEIRLTEETAGGRREASRVLAYQPTGDGVRSRVVSAEGDFGGDAWQDRPVNPLPRLLPDEPAFLTSQSREQYRYAAGPDTVVGGRRLRVVEARLRPEAAGEQALRRARYLLDPRSDAVLGVEVARASGAAFFDEAGTAAVYLQPAPGGALVPALAVSETTVDVPGSATRRLRLEQRFRDVRAD